MSEEVKVGSVWRENDRRFDRYVKVIGTDGPLKVLIVGCDAAGRTGLAPRTTAAQKARFGRGYKLVKAAAK